MKNRTSGLYNIISKVYTPIIHGRVQFLRASATVEASFVMPLFIYAITAVLYLLQIIMIKQDISVAAYNSVRTLSKYSYAYDKLTESEKEVSAITAYGIFLTELGVDYAKENYIVGGNAGLVLAGTDVLADGAGISITVTYAVKNPFDVFGLGVVTLTQTYESQGWLGDKELPQDVLDAKINKLVYITIFGDVYHTQRECAYIALSLMAVSADNLENMRNLGGGKYYPCETCIVTDWEKSGKTVYVTEYGNRYHSAPDCSGIKRTVIAVPLSQIRNRHQCTKCAGKQVSNVY